MQSPNTFNFTRNGSLPGGNKTFAAVSGGPFVEGCFYKTNSIISKKDNTNN